MISAAERKELIAAIKKDYPVGTEIWDQTYLQPYRIKKRSIFIVVEWTYSVPPEDRDIEIDFFVKDPGGDSRINFIKSFPKRWMLEKYAYLYK